MHLSHYTKDAPPPPPTKMRLTNVQATFTLPRKDKKISSMCCRSATPGFCNDNRD